MSRRLRVATLSLRAWMACQAVFIVLAVTFAPEEKQTLTNVIGVALANVAILSLAAWISVGVQCGRRLTAAAGLLIFYGVGGLAAGSAVLATGGYKGSSILLAWMPVLFFAWLSSVIAVLRVKPVKIKSG